MLQCLPDDLRIAVDAADEIHPPCPEPDSASGGSSSIFARSLARACTIPVSSDAFCRAGAASALMHRVIENLQRAAQLLALHDREAQSSSQDAWVQAARAHVVDATTLLEQHGARPESRRSAIELILKAELALASVDSPGTDLSFRVADQLLLEARVRLEAIDAESR